MSAFVLSLVIVQGLLGGYQWSCVASADRASSPTRASRLPPSVLFLHPFLALVGAIVWITWMNTGNRGVAWAGFVIFATGLTLGASMGLRTVGRSRYVSAPADTDHAADVAVVERTIPTPALALHGLIGLAIVLLSLFLALGKIS